MRSSSFLCSLTVHRRRAGVKGGLICSSPSTRSRPAGDGDGVGRAWIGAGADVSWR
jgi:hypothetical protein